MASKELKRLSRSELLEMLISQTEENEQLREQVANLQHSLNERRIFIEKAGSIAEASLAINKVFQAAEAAAQDYLSNIRVLSERQDKITKRNVETQESISRMVDETQTRCRQLESDTLKKCEEMKANAKREADKYWDSVYSKLESYLAQHSELRKLINLDASIQKIIYSDVEPTDINIQLIRDEEE